jgi:hypothetical protein
MTRDGRGARVEIRWANPLRFVAHGHIGNHDGDVPSPSGSDGLRYRNGYRPGKTQPKLASQGIHRSTNNRYVPYPEPRLALCRFLGEG